MMAVAEQAFQVNATGLSCGYGLRPSTKPLPLTRFLRPERPATLCGLSEAEIQRLIDDADAAECAAATADQHLLQIHGSPPSPPTLPLQPSLLHPPSAPPRLPGAAPAPSPPPLPPPPDPPQPTAPLVDMSKPPPPDLHDGSCEGCGKSGGRGSSACECSWPCPKGCGLLVFLGGSRALHCETCDPREEEDETDASESDGSERNGGESAGGESGSAVDSLDWSDDGWDSDQPCYENPSCVQVDDSYYPGY